MLTKKRFSKKINYAAISNLFGASKDGDDDGIDEPILGKTHGAPANQRKRNSAKTAPAAKRGQAIQIPMPTFAGRAGSRQPSEAPTPRRQQAEPEASPEAEQHVEEEEDEEVEEWRKVMGGHGGDDGIGFDYEEEI